MTISNFQYIILVTQAFSDPYSDHTVNFTLETTHLSRGISINLSSCNSFSSLEESEWSAEDVSSSSNLYKDDEYQQTQLLLLDPKC